MSMVEKFSLLLAGSEIFIIDDIITDESLDNCRQFLTQSYLAVLKNLRGQPNAIFVWYSKEIAYLKMIHDENNCLRGDELIIVRDVYAKVKTCKVIYTMEL